MNLPRVQGTACGMYEFSLQSDHYNTAVVHYSHFVPATPAHFIPHKLMKIKEKKEIILWTKEPVKSTQSQVLLITNFIDPHGEERGNIKFDNAQMFFRLDQETSSC